MLFFVCRFYGLSFFLLNIFKIKTICWKQSTKKWKYIHYKSIPLILFFRPMWLPGLLTPVCITLLLPSALLQPPSSLVHYPVRMGIAGGTDQWELQGDSYLARPVWVKKVDHTGSVCSTHTRSRRHECIWGPAIPPCPKGDIDERPEWFLGGKQCPLESTVRLKSHKAMKGKEPRFRIHRQIVNNK